MVSGMKANSSALPRSITHPPRTDHRPKCIRVRQIDISGPMLIASCPAVFSLAPQRMSKYEEPMIPSSTESKLIHPGATGGLAEARMAEPADQNSEAEDSSACAMMTATDQPSAPAVPIAANDAIRDMQVPSRLARKHANLTGDNRHFVGNRHDGPFGRPKTELPVRQTKGGRHVS